VETRFVHVNGGTLAIDDYQDGARGREAVIMPPGMAALRSEYRFLAPQIRTAGTRSISVDVHGHGGSSVPWSDYVVSSVGRDLLAMNTFIGILVMLLLIVLSGWLDSRIAWRPPAEYPTRATTG
jgi:pimeloyl-ACP methyl ester carboxylesterase